MNLDTRWFFERQLAVFGCEFYGHDVFIASYDHTYTQTKLFAFQLRRSTQYAMQGQLFTPEFLMRGVLGVPPHQESSDKTFSNKSSFELIG